MLEKISDPRFTSEEYSREMLSFMTETSFEDRIPAALPESTRVAHKIGTHAAHRKPLLDFEEPIRWCLPPSEGDKDRADAKAASYGNGRRHRPRCDPQQVPQAVPSWRRCGHGMPVRSL